MFDDVGFGDVDFDFFRFGQNGDSGGGSMDAALGLGFGDALDAVASAFVAEFDPDTVTFDGKNDFLETTHLRAAEAERFDLPAALFGVASVHAVQVTGEERRFVAAGAGADFHDDRANDGIVAHDQFFFDLLEELLDLRFECLEFFGGQVLHFRIVEHGFGVGQLGGKILIAAVAVDEVFELAMLFGDFDDLVGIAGYPGIVHLLFEGGETFVHFSELGQNFFIGGG